METERETEAYADEKLHKVEQNYTEVQYWCYHKMISM